MKNEGIYGLTPFLKTAAGSTLAVTDSLLTLPQRFYRLVLLP